MAATLLGSAILVAACGGGTATTGPDGATTAPDATATATPAATGAASAAPSASTAVALPSFDLSGLVANLDGVDSYRVKISTNGESQYDAVVVTKPVLSRDVTLTDGTRIVVIGDEAWIGQGDDLQPAPAAMATPMLAAFDPILLVGAFSAPGAMTGATEVGTEEKNGVQARHFRIDSSSFVGSIASMPPGSAIDLWVADEGYLVSMSVSGMGEGSFAMDVTDVNDAANVVERPS